MFTSQRAPRRTSSRARSEKIASKQAGLRLELEPTPDILRELGARKGERFLVGFAAETHDLREHAQAKLAAKGVDLIVANDVSRTDIGFDAAENEVVLLDRKDLPVREILDLAVGSVIKMTRSAGENIDIRVGGAIIGFGEIVILEDKMGVRITDFQNED